MATSYTAEQRKIQRQIERLMRQQEELKKKERLPVIKMIVGEMRAYNIEPEEIAAAYGSKVRGRPKGKTSAEGAKVATKRATKKVAPKYRDPDSGATWTGRGRAPAWVVKAEQEGKSRDNFLIESDTQGESSQESDSAAPIQSEE